MKVCLILFPEFQMLAYVLATETMRIANKSANQPLFHWETRTPTAEAVKASNGATIMPDSRDWNHAASFDLVLLCAGYNPVIALPSGLRAFLARADQSGAVLGGLDTGTIVLARLGLLAGRKAVLHYEAEPGFRESWPDIAVSDQIYCFDKRRLTAAGGMATGDAMLAWIAATVSHDLAILTSEAMAHGIIRNSNERQRIAQQTDPLIRQLKQILLAHIQEPLSISVVAQKMGLSQKRLRNRCRRAVNSTPSAYYLNIRIERALFLLQNTGMTITEISIATGFGSLAGFCRTFRNQFGKSPREMRAATHRQEARATLNN